jgi:hypothetical protein
MQVLWDVTVSVGQWFLTVQNAFIFRVRQICEHEGTVILPNARKNLPVDVALHLTGLSSELFPILALLFMCCFY